MKKRILVLAAIFGASASFAQVTTLKSKKGFEILPEAGDYAIQFDATPMLDFALNAVKMGASTGNTAGNTFNHINGFGANGTTIVGKYFKDASTAYRVKVGINTGATSQDVFYNNVDITKDDKLTETIKTNFTQIALGGGIEFRRGHNRLQGFYGGEAMLTIGSQNPLGHTELSSDIETAVNDYGYAASYVSEQKGSRFQFGLAGIAGIEYFVLPKISLGAQVSWGLNYTSKTKVTTTVETLVAPGDVDVTEVEANPVGSNFGFGTAYSSNIFATFHF